jgi:ParB family transcriptional regulator, chromosome partitioning protein
VMAKDFRSTIGGNLAESMGANRTSLASRVEASQLDRLDGTERLRSAALIDLDRIVPDPDQPRKDFPDEAIQRLAASLKEHGQLQPIAVRWSDSMGRYLIVSGERRYRASLTAGRSTIAAVILEGDRTESQVLELQLIENCLREDLQPIEQARAFRTLMERNGWSALRLANALQMSESSVLKSIALLSLPGTVQDRVESGELAPSVAYEVSKLDDPATQDKVAARVIREGLSRAETIQAVKQASKSSSGKGRGGKPAKAAKLPTERTTKTQGGFKIVVSHRKGFDDVAWLEALEEVARTVRTKIESETEGSEQVAA